MLKSGKKSQQKPRTRRFTSEAAAKLLREAMDNTSPKVTKTALAKACGVTLQAVTGWRKTGRYHREHVPTMAKLTNTPLAYWLAVTDPQKAPDPKDPYLFQLLKDWNLLMIPERKDIQELVFSKAEYNRTVGQHLKNVEHASDGAVEKAFKKKAPATTKK